MAEDELLMGFLGKGVVIRPEHNQEDLTLIPF